MRSERRSGVTLIEILIAVSLLSLLTVGVLTAMQLGLRTMDKVDSRMVRNRRVTSARAIIENEISGLVATLALVPQTSNRLVPFFQAEPQSMRFVTSFSLEDAWRGQLQIAALQVVPGENNAGVRLIVNELAYTGEAQAGQFVSGFERDETGRTITRFAPIVAGPESFVVADRLRYCRFLYLEKRPAPLLDGWRTDWVDTNRFPAGVRIEMESLDKSPADLHASDVTVPLQITVPPGAVYAIR